MYDNAEHVTIPSSTDNISLVDSVSTLTDDSVYEDGSSSFLLQRSCGGGGISKSTGNDSFGYHKLKFSEHGLFGREKEIDTLKEICYGIEQKPSTEGKSNPSPQVVFVNGEAGIGKSSLINQLQPIVVSELNGFWLMGKYEQQRRRHLEQQQEDKKMREISSSNDGSNSSTFGSNGNGGLSEAFQCICQTILEHKFDPTITGWKFTFDEIRTKLIQELDECDLELLCNFMPRLKMILETPPTTKSNVTTSPTMPTLPEEEESTSKGGNSSNGSTTVSYEDRKYRFTRAMKCFVRVLNSFGPIVIVLDDIQWANSFQTLFQLLESILFHKKLSNIMFVGLYRSEDITPGHPILHWMDQLQASMMTVKTDNGVHLDQNNNQNIPTTATIETNFHQIHLDNLTIGDIIQMLTNQFGIEPDNIETQALALCIHRKTLGNCFYIVQFLQSLVRDDLMVYKITSQTWEWDTNIIAERTSMTENVADFMVIKLRKLPSRITRLLPIVASLGHIFVEDVVALIVNYLSHRLFGSEIKDDDHSEHSATTIKVKNNNETTTNFLTQCEMEGIIFRTGDGRYQFEHDKIQVSMKLQYGTCDSLEALVRFNCLTCHDIVVWLFSFDFWGTGVGFIANGASRA